MNQEQIKRYTRGTELNSTHITILTSLSQGKRMSQLKGSSLYHIADQTFSGPVVETLLDLNYIDKSLKISGNPMGHLFLFFTITGRGLDFLDTFNSL